MKPPTLALIVTLTVIAVVILVASLFLRPKKVLKCHELMGQLYPYILRGLRRYLESDTPETAGAWGLIQGFIGLRKIQRNTGVLVKLCQLREDRDDLYPGEMDEVMHLATDARLKANKAVAVGMLGSATPEMQDEAAAEALRAYSLLADRTHTLYALGGAPLCAMRLQELL